MIDISTIDFNLKAPTKEEEKPAASARRDLLRQEVESLTSKLEFRGPSPSAKPVPAVELSFTGGAGRKQAPRIAPVAPLDYKPSLLDNAFKAVSEGSGTFAILGGVAFLGVLWLLAGWGAPTITPKRAGAPEIIRFHCVGNIHVPSSASFTDVNLMVELPQVPFRTKTYSWAEVAHPTSQSYDCSIDLKLFKPPGFFNVHVTEPGCKEAVSKQVPIPPNADQVLVPDLFLKKADP